MKIKVQRILDVLLFGGIFLFLTVFFTQVHPLLPYDMDDWSYLSFRRNAYPIWGNWNPARVFPETFMALISDIGVYLYTPLFHMDYLHGQILAHGMAVALFITIYVFLFRRFLKRKLHTGDGNSILLTLLFLLVHFSIFRSEHDANEHLFWTFNLTGYWYYVIPNLVNASLVLWLLGTTAEERKRAGYVQKGILVLISYLAILSNIFPTAILMVWLGEELLQTVYTMKKRGKHKPKEWLSALSWQLPAFALWFVSLIFEANGGRAGDASPMDLKASITRFFAWAGRLNKQSAALLGGIAIAAIALYLTDKKHKNISKEDAGLMTAFVIAAILCSVFEILLCAKVDPEKMELSRVIFPVCFYVFLFVLTAAERLIAASPKTVIALPLILYILLINTRIGERTFLDQNGTNLDGKRAAALTQYILDQAVTADEEGLERAELHVPAWQQEDNWPHAYGLGESVSQTLYRHGIVSRRIEFTVVPDKKVNELFSIEDTAVDLSRGIRR
ncbi:MAG: hypothetical protein IKI75_13185 [Lachnospiraceae bacterium]|nr:hypothetical protein [Lachnospiraceae bacterium]